MQQDERKDQHDPGHWQEGVSDHTIISPSKNHFSAWHMEPSVADGWAKSVSENEAVTRHEPLKKKNAAEEILQFSKRGWLTSLKKLNTCSDRENGENRARMDRSIWFSGHCGTRDDAGDYARTCERICKDRYGLT